MKLQIYHDPWLQFLTEIVPSAEIRAHRQRCREKVAETVRDRNHAIRAGEKLWEKNQRFKDELAEQETKYRTVVAEHVAVAKKYRKLEKEYQEYRSGVEAKARLDAAAGVSKQGELLKASIERSANLERARDAAQKAYEQVSRDVNILREEKRQGWAGMTEAFARDVEMLRKEIFKLRAENAALRGAQEEARKRNLAPLSTSLQTTWLKTT